MTIEEAEEKLSNMHFDNIVKSYCNKVNDIKRLKAEIKKLNEQLRQYNVVGQREQLCDLDGKTVLVKFKVTKYIPKIVIEDI